MSSSVLQYAEDTFSMYGPLPPHGEKKEKQFTRNLVDYEFIISLADCNSVHLCLRKIELLEVSPARLVDIIFGIKNICGVSTEATVRNFRWTEFCSIFLDIASIRLTLTESFMFYAHVIWKDTPIFQTPISPKEPTLQSELAEFLTNPTFSDVTIVIKKEKLSAHKIILAAASPVISIMLKSSMRESQEGKIEIEDIEVEIMQTILKFLYTGKDEDLNNVAVALDVLRIAEKYEMVRLKYVCEQKLFIKLNVENVVKVITAADTYNAENLKCVCLNFIMLHKDEVKKQDAFKKLCLTRPELMYELLMNSFL